MQTVIGHIHSHSPAGAEFYRLVGKLPNGELGLFPKDGNAFYKIGFPPTGVYPGAYQVFYFDASGKQILHLRVELQLTEADRVELSSTESGTSLAPGTSQASLSAQIEKSQSQRHELAKEQLEHRMSIDKDEQEKSFIQNSVYVREIGENLMVSRMLRQELLELQKVVQEQKNIAYSDVEKQVAAARMLGQLQKEIMASAALIPRPEPPKPDLNGLGASFIDTVRGIGMALIQKESSKNVQSPVNKPNAGASLVSAVEQPQTQRATEYKPAPLIEPIKEKPAHIDWILMKSNRKVIRLLNSRRGGLVRLALPKLS